MLKFPDFLEFLKDRNDQLLTEDLSDRLNVVISFYMLIFFALVATAGQNFGDPINCFIPVENPEGWIKFFNGYCFVKNKATFTTPFNEHNWWRDKDNDQSSVLVYYQWVPYILIVQAILFLLPRGVWTIASEWFIVDMDSLVKELVDTKKLSGIDRKKAIKRVSNYLCTSLNLNSKRSLFGRSVTAFFVLKKWVAVLNVVGQFLFLAWIIPHNFNVYWGAEVLASRWTSTSEDIDGVQGFFPFIVRCDVDQVDLAQKRPWKFPCVLMMNFINEKLFVIIYFWLLFVLLANILSALYATLLLISSSYRSYVADRLMPDQDVLVASAEKELGIQSYPIQGRNLTDHFVSNILRTDGVLFLSFVLYHADGLIVHELVTQLWKSVVQPIAAPLQESETTVTLRKPQPEEETKLLEAEQSIDYSKVTLTRGYALGGAPKLQTIYDDGEEEDNNNNC